LDKIVAAIIINTEPNFQSSSMVEANCNRPEGLCQLQHIAELVEMAGSRCIMAALGTVGTVGTHTEVSTRIPFL